MDLTKHEKMNVLLQQLQFNDDIIQQYFNNSQLLKVEVFKQSKKWHFHIQINKLLPFQIYQLFISKLQTAFKSIAELELTLYTEDKSYSSDELVQYWNHFLQSSVQLSPAHKDLLFNQTPNIDNHSIEIFARNDAEAAALEKRLVNKIKSFIKQIGGPPLGLKVLVKQQLQDVQKFQEEKTLEDQQFALEAIKNQQKRDQSKEQADRPLQIGVHIKEEPIQMKNILEEELSAVIQGYVFSAEIRKLRSGRSLLLLKVTDYTDSFEIKMFSRNDEDEEKFNHVKKGIWVKARGRVQTDNFSNELVLMANDIHEITVEKRKDTTKDKRVELHTHTKMSQLDSVASASDLIAQAADWGHPAIAITDHSGVQAFPEAFSASQKHNIKVIYGLEANIVDDGVPIAYNVKNIDLKTGTYIVFDVETTGLSAVYDTIIEIAGVKVQNGEITDRYESFANPNKKLPKVITELTGITDDMVKDARQVDVVLREFHEWIGEDILVAHNASFDIGFLNAGFKKAGLEIVHNPVIDTLELARYLYPQLGNHRLNTLCKHLNIELISHHRAIYDAEATGHLLWKFVTDLLERKITNHNELNDHIGEGDAYKRARPHHAILLAKNQTGLKNLYKLVSYSHTEYFYRGPRIPRSLLQKHREGILIGSSCSQGEVFETMMQKSLDEAEKVAEFYDYIEVQPPSTYAHLVEIGLVNNEAQILDIVRKLVELGQRMNKLVVATGNVHHLESRDKIYREILIASQKGNPLNRHSLPDTSFKTTDEMVESFNFLGESKAFEVVVENTNKINHQIEDVTPLQDGLYTPNIDGAEEEIRQLSYKNAKKIYGENLPSIVKDRLEKELSSIIGHGFAVIYLISHKLVKKSLLDGYLVGSRGSVGSSLVATMTEITEVNPLPPHYVCTTCHYHQFVTDGSVASGFDLPDKNCPTCEQPLTKDGQDIPFETFLGFEGDKVPDIDLNFSGEYQPIAHNYTKELFGSDNVFRAGTIGTIAERTAFGYVKGYANDHDLYLKNAEVDRLVNGCTGVKRTTGQHPGGIIVVPKNKEIYDFTPIQYPADDRKSEWKTTHFDFHSIENNLLKLDILGHDDPTVIRMLQDLSGKDPVSIPIDDEEVMKIFSSTESLQVAPEQINCKTGTLGVPEFGTPFVRQMLEETKPKTFAELVIISGLSHGTDVWLGNAQELVNNGICELPDVIGCRDDIMVYLMHKGLSASLAFTIMESVRKGRGLNDEWIEEMKKHDVPAWYIDSCLKIKYMFPKAHAVAYVLMAVRIAYFKVHYPIYFYAAYFSVRATDFELDTMIRGSEALRERIEEIRLKGNDASPKEKGLQNVLNIALEMCERGFSFQRVDLYKSEATQFIIEGNTLIPPFSAVDGLGTNAAYNIVEARKDGEFLSKEDLRERTKISNTVIDYLDQHGCLEGMADKNQLSLF